MPLPINSIDSTSGVIRDCLPTILGQSVLYDSDETAGAQLKYVILITLFFWCKSVKYYSNHLGHITIL